MMTVNRYVSRFVGVQGFQPLIVRSKENRVHILSAEKLWVHMPRDPSRWKTLCMKEDGSSGWYKMRRIIRFPVRDGRRFESITSPATHFQALGGFDALYDAYGLTAPAPAPLSPPAINLKEEFSRPRSACRQIVSIEYSPDGFMNLEGCFSKLKYIYEQDSEDLCALARITAAYLIVGRVHQAAAMSQWTRTMLRLSSPGRADSEKLTMLLCNDVEKLTESKELVKDSYNYTMIDSRTLTAALVLLCGHGFTRCVPSFVLDGSPAVRKAFLSTYEAWGQIRLTPSLRPYAFHQVCPVVAAGLTYLWSLQDPEKKIHFMAMQASHCLMMHIGDEDPFPRWGEPFRIVKRKVGRAAYAIKVQGQVHFIEGVSRIPLRTQIESLQKRWVDPVAKYDDEDLQDPSSKSSVPEPMQWC